MPSKPRVFIGSSVEGLSVAYAVQQNLTYDLEATVWSQGVFELSSTVMESLTETLKTMDFAIFVFTPDDAVKIRGKSSPSVRDNVIFEMGLFIGKLGRNRVFFIAPNREDGQQDDLHLPSDLFGVTHGTYDAHREDGNLEAATGSTCNQVRKQSKPLGFFNAPTPELTKPDETEPSQEKNSWLPALIRKNYEEAENKITDEIATADAVQKLTLQAYAHYITYKKSGSQDIKPILAYAAEHRENAEVHSTLAFFLRLEGYSLKAIELLNSLEPQIKQMEIIVDSLADCYRDRGEYEDAVKVISESSLKNGPILALRLAGIYLEQEDSEAAFKVVREALAETPNDETLRFKCARIAQDLQHHKISAYLLKRLTRDFPKSDEYWGYFGNSCFSLELKDQALLAYRIANTLAENKAAWILGNIGNVFISTELPSEATEFLKRATEIDAEAEYAHARLSSALTAKTQEEKKLESFCKEGKILLRDFKDEPQSDAPSALPGLSSLLGG